jgi:hypothetical protein
VHDEHSNKAQKLVSCRIRETISAEDPDPTMAAALPPGAWWQRANTGAWQGQAEPYGPHAGDAAVQAAQRGNLELRHVSFSYPMRPKMAGVHSDHCPMLM